MDLGYSDTMQSITELLSEKPPQLEDLANSHPIHTAKYRKMFSGENTKDITGQILLEILGVEHMDPMNYLRKTLSAWTKGDKQDKMKKVCQTSKILQVRNNLIITTQL